MASLPPSLTSLLFLTLALILIIFVTPAFSISRRALDHRSHHDHLAKNGFRITLKHVDAGGNFTKFERLERAMKRGRHRLQKLSQMVLAATDSNMKSSVFPGNGEFLMKLSIGTPPESFSAILDTGSDLLWTQCKPCQQCYDQPTPVFDPKKSSSFSKMACSSDLCKALPTSSCGDGCEYLYSYGDYSSTQGILATETFTFDDTVSVPNIGFGCGEDNEGSGFSQGAGLVGLGRGPLSLVTQLGKPKFSYCLTSVDDNKPSTLFIGSHASIINAAASTKKGDIKITPLVKNPSQPSFYYLSLEGITVGDTKLPIKKSTFALNTDGSGGLIIDSGTTITYLEDSAFALVKKAFTSQVKLPVATSSSTGLDLCFTLPSGSSSVEIPALVFHFAGVADLDLPGENYMIADSSLGLMCLAMGGSNGMSIFGNVQQQNMLVVHDLDKETLSFLPTECDKL